MKNLNEFEELNESTDPKKVIATYKAYDSIIKDFDKLMDTLNKVWSSAPRDAEIDGAWVAPKTDITELMDTLSELESGVLGDIKNNHFVISQKFPKNKLK